VIWRAVPAWCGDALIGLAIATGGAVLAVLAWPIPRGEVGNPGPGFLPLVLGLLLIVLGLACAVLAVRAREMTPTALGSNKMLICIVAVGVAALAFIPLGFIVTMTVFLAVLFRALGSIPWWRAALSAAAATVALWLVFDQALGVRLPPGVLPL
jgi:putative tricarboxylic transport membrane protein